MHQTAEVKKTLAHFAAVLEVTVYEPNDNKNCPKREHDDSAGIICFLEHIEIE